MLLGTQFHVQNEDRVVLHLGIYGMETVLQVGDSH